LPSLQRTPSGVWKARKRLPKDVQEEYARLHGKSWEGKLTLPAGTKHPEAKRRLAQWYDEVEGNIAAIRR
jgi:hypothetical protein